MTDLPKYYIIIIIFVAIPKWQQQPKPSTSVMMKFQISSINILKQGLTKLHNQNQERKARLTAKFQAGQSISEIDQEWLGGNGNLVNEEWVVGTLDNVSDYEQGLARLNSHDKTVADKLQKVAEGGGKSDAPSKKQKHRDFKIFDNLSVLSIFFVGPNTTESASCEKIQPSAKFHKKENTTLAQ